MNPSKVIAISFDIFLDYILVIRKLIIACFRVNPPKAWQTGDMGDVILLPGFTETWVFLVSIANHLSNLGYRIHVVRGFGRSTGAIESDLAKLQALITKLGLKNITLLSHSRGGILAKLLLDDPKYSSYIRQSISIATPYHGSLLANVPFRYAREMSPKSRYIKSILVNMQSNAKIINIYPLRDNKVLLSTSLVLTGAKNICLNVVGHTRILESNEILNTLDSVLSNQ